MTCPPRGVLHYLCEALPTTYSQPLQGGDRCTAGPCRSAERRRYICIFFDILMCIPMRRIILA